jgi:signal peptidase I
MSDFPIEPYKLSSWAKSSGFVQCFLYLGPSMTPTFQSGDLLYTRPTPRKLFIGDVVVFSDTKTDGYIVHRIVKAFIGSLITKGDHNRLCDAPLSLDQVVGKVELVENKAGKKRVINGRLGLWMAQLKYINFVLDAFFRWVFRGPYNFLRHSGLVPAIWKPTIVKIQLLTEEGTLIKYIHKHRTVAMWNSSIQEFFCLKPYDLVIICPEGSKENVFMV